MHWFSNVIGAAGAVFKRRSAASTANLLELQDETGAVTLYVDSTGRRIVGRVNGADVPLEFADIFTGELGVSVPLVRLTGGRFDLDVAGTSAEVRVQGGTAATLLRFFNLAQSKTFLDLTVTNATLPGTLTFGNATVQRTAVQTAVVTADVTNNSATANTLANVTGLSFPVVAGKTYRFWARVWFTSAAATTGMRLSVTGPASPTLLWYDTARSTSATAVTSSNGHTAYALPTAATTAALTAGNFAELTGTIRPSAAGTVQMTFASSVASSAIVIRTGSFLEFVQLD